MKEGVVDNYLTDEENKYFESHGKENTSIEESEKGLPDNETPAEDNRTSEESQEGDVTKRDGNLHDADQRRADDSAEHEDNDPDDSDNLDSEPGKTRDFEKAFKSERHKRKELKETLEAQARKTQELEATLAKLQNNFQSQEQQRLDAAKPKEVVPDPDEDPIGYQQYKINKLEEAIYNQSKYLRDQYDANQRSAQENAFRAEYEKQARDYMGKNSEFKDAYNYLMQSRISEHQAAGFSSAQAEQLVIEDELAVVAQAFKDKVNPAERIYNIAKARGFDNVKKTSQSSTKDLNSLKKGLNASKSLSQSAGDPPEKSLHLDDINDMDFDEFDSYFNKIKQSQKGIR